MNGRHGSHRNATSPRRPGCSCGAASRRVAARTTRARHLNLIPGCVWSLASPAACIAAAASARTRVCVRGRQSPFTHALSQTGRVTALVIPDGPQGARGGFGLVHWRHSAEGWCGRARTRAPCTWHAEVDSAT